MKKLDLTGERFGRLTVIEEAGKNCGHITWRCRCDCGNEVIVAGIHLKSGHTTSCSCRQKEVVSSIRFEDLAGKKFGRLTVIEKIGTNKNGCYEWLCQCECGNLTKVNSSALRRGTTLSCGCLQKEKASKKLTIDMINFENEHFKVIERDTSSKNRTARWKCICKHCGNVFTIEGKHLRA